MLADPSTFLGVSALVIVTPGQDTALVIKNSLACGRRGGLFTAFGVATGQGFWTLASGAGLTALLLASGPAFAAVKLAGSAYLVWLGARSLLVALSANRSEREPAPVHREGNLTPSAAFRQGMLSALGNAKLAVFFVSLFPQFVPHGRNSLPILLGLGLTFCAMTLIWPACYAIVVGKAGDVLGRPWIRRAAGAVLGAALVAFGIRIAAEHR